MVKEAGLRTGGDYIDAPFGSRDPADPSVDHKGPGRCFQEDPWSRRPPVTGLSTQCRRLFPASMAGPSVRAMFDRIASGLRPLQCVGEHGPHQHWRPRALAARAGQCAGAGYRYGNRRRGLFCYSGQGIPWWGLISRTNARQGQGKRQGRSHSLDE